MTPTGGRTSGSSLLFACLLLLGLVARVGLAPLDGPPRVAIWKIWSANAVTDGVAALYADDPSTGGRRLLEYEHRHSSVSSPPGALYSLQLAGELYRRHDPSFSDGPLLTAAVKLPGVVAELVLIGLIYLAVRRLMDARSARWALLAYWLNPAVILGGAVLGFLTPVVAMTAVGALICTTWGYPAIAGVLIAASLLTDLGAIILLPALAMALNRRAPLRTEAYMWATAGAVVTAMVMLTPLATRGTLPSATRLLAAELRLEDVRDRALDVWAILPPLPDVELTANAASSPVATAPAPLDLVTAAMNAAAEDYRLWAVPLLILIAAFGLWRARAVRFLPGWAGLAALLAHAMSLIDVGVTSGSLMLAVAFLAIASAESARYRVFLGVLTALLGANLLLGPDGRPLTDALITLDRTAPLHSILALISGLALLWHTALFSSECSREAPRLRTRAREARYALAARAEP